VTIVTVEDPRQSAVENMLRAGDSYALSLYPAESCYMLSADELMHPDVTVFVARDAAARALGMAALVSRGDFTGELKRLFVDENVRGQKVATVIMDALEAAARAQGIHTLQLETGPKQHAAIALYERRGYARIPNFGPYIGDEFSLCMQRELP